MASNSFLRRLRADSRGATLVEFAIIINVLFAITFAIIEFALAWWQWNSAEAALQAGVHFAVESNPVAEMFSGYGGYNGVVDGGFDPGTPLTTDIVPTFTVTCTGTSCTCASTCPPKTNGNITATTRDATAFTAILTVVQSIFPSVQAANLVITYQHIGLGIAGRPGINLVPAVTLTLTGLTYNFILLDTFGLNPISMPDFRTTLTAEDLNSCAPDAASCP